MEPLGRSPVAVPILVLGKLAIVGNILFFVLKGQFSGMLLFDSTITRVLGVLLAAVGLLLVVLGIIKLGRSVSVGLPGEETELKTRGIYRFTRNPIYLGAYLACAGSCFFTIHPVNFLLAAIAVGIHHVIVLREEEFLTTRFGQQWLDYKQRVPRYLAGLF